MKYFIQEFFQCLKQLLYPLLKKVQIAYRPRSETEVFKIMECNLTVRVITGVQYGFQSGCSTFDAIVALQNHISQKLKNKQRAFSAVLLNIKIQLIQSMEKSYGTCINK